MRYLSVLIVLGMVCRADAQNPGLDFFETKIRPALTTHCLSCHSQEAQAKKKLRGGLLLDTRAGWQKGGDSGKIIVPGKPAESLLMKAIEYGGDVAGMPPKGKLPDTVIADFRKWIELGAPDPRDGPAAVGTEPDWSVVFQERRAWWSLQPLQPVNPPENPPVAHPVDRFLHAKFQAKGIVPAGETDKATLLRRASYLLIGLPPTPEELTAFLADTSADAYERVIERLLNSPRFGERWAQHWLDLMRYAETHGSEGDPAIPFAWRYRDYLIRAFNSDLPYDRLIREHLAGDLLPPRINPALGINESIIGLAPLRMVEHGFQPVDALEEKAKTIDNQIEVITKAFQGLTVSCARCHNHKFDAISRQDYYALYGVFSTARPAQVTIDDPDREKARQAELARLKLEIKRRLIETWRLDADRLARDLADSLRPPQESPEEAAARKSLTERLQEIDRRIDELERRSGVPQAFAVWRFDGNARDSQGTLHGELISGATIRNGRLYLDGCTAFMRTVPLTKNIEEKTLEAWVSVANLDQRGGGVLTIETGNGAVFDAIVFAEKQPREWMSGSDHFHRTRDLGGPKETAASDEMVHLALVHTSEGTIRLYRNGKPYGRSYNPLQDGMRLPIYSAGDARILLGLRHTGGGNAHFAGSIEEARLYDRALSAGQIAASFAHGPNGKSVASNASQLSAEETAALTRFRRERDEITAELHKRDSAQSQKPVNLLIKAIAEAKNDPQAPLHPWAILHALNAEKLPHAWRKLAEVRQADRQARQQFNRTHFTSLANPSTADGYAAWFRHGFGLPGSPSPAGEFFLHEDPTFLVSGIYPAGVYTHTLSRAYNGIFTSPSFRLPKSVWIRFMAESGGGVRVIVENYPLGANGTYPANRPQRNDLHWHRFDTTYREGASAYLEFATLDDLTRPERATNKSAIPGRSSVGVVQVLLSDERHSPQDEILPTIPLLQQQTPTDIATLIAAYRSTFLDALAAWESETITAEQAAFLDWFIRRDLLRNRATEAPIVSAIVNRYRELESQIPTPLRAPGVLETVGSNQPIFERGNHKNPGASVPRAYLAAINGSPFPEGGSGRRELAEAIASPTNPLTARVAVNRLWHHAFGRGIVASTDNFGKLGELPTHPELLDWLAGEFIRSGWSIKRILRLLVTSAAFKQSSLPHESALRIDAANLLFSRSRVRRLDAEAIRDTFLQVSGGLHLDEYGPGSSGGNRRSIYLTVVRNSPQSFLEVFDKPPAMTTRGERDTTNTPAQALTLLNAGFVHDCARRWGAAIAAAPGTRTDKVRSMYLALFARPATADETKRAEAFLGELPSASGWSELAHALFCAKEAIYLR